MQWLLVVDDHKSHRQMLGDIFASWGYGVQTAKNGKEAFEKVKAKAPDLIISDILMPVMDGFEFCREIKKDEGLRHIPFVFCTGTYTSMQDENFAFNLGADQFISKPIDTTLLHQVVKDLLNVSADRPATGNPEMLMDEKVFLEKYNNSLILKLENKAERLKAIFNVAESVMLVLKPDFRIIEFNPAAERLYGRPKNEVIGKNYVDLFVPVGFHATFTRDFEKVLKGVSKTGLENFVISADGSEKTLLWDVARLKNSFGDIDGVIAIGTDITERKQTEQKLRENEKKYRTLFNSSTDAITLLDAYTGKYIGANKAALKLHDVQSEDQIIDRTPARFSPEFQANGKRSDMLAKEYIKKAFVVGSLEFEWIHCKKDKVPFSTKVTLSALELGTKRLVMAIVRDISERKISEIALKESEERYRQVVETIIDGIVVSKTNGEIQFVNSAFCDIYQYNKDEVVGMHATHLIQPEFHPVFQRFVQDLNQHGFFSGETIDVRKDGSTFCTDVKGVKIHYRGEDCFLAIIRDVTEQKQADKEKERLISDLKTALGKIKTLSGLVPICSECKKIRDDKGYWNKLEAYIEEHSDAAFSHSMCPQCSDKLYGNEDWYIEMKKKRGSD